MNNCFKDLLDVYVVIYLDDILIYPENPNEHESHEREAKRDSLTSQLSLLAGCNVSVGVLESSNFVELGYFEGYHYKPCLVFCAIFEYSEYLNRRPPKGVKVAVHLGLKALLRGGKYSGNGRNEDRHLVPRHFCAIEPLNNDGDLLLHLIHFPFHTRIKIND